MLAEVGLGLHAIYLSKMPQTSCSSSSCTIESISSWTREKERKERPNDKKNKTKENDFISVFPNNFPWDVSRRTRFHVLDPGPLASVQTH